MRTDTAEPRKISVGLCWMIVGIFFMAGCGRHDDAIHVYTVPKTTNHHKSPLLNGGDDGHGHDSPLNLVDWQVPESWEQLNINLPMVLAVFQPEAPKDAAQVQVSAFPGDVGGVLANINRWRKQIELEPITDQDLSKHLQTLQTQGSFGGMMDEVNPQTQQRTLAVIIQGGAGMSWFIKATGPTAQVEPLKDSMVQFAQSMKFKPAPISQESEHIHDRDSQTSVNSTPSASEAVAGQTNAGNEVQIATPSNWASRTPSSQFLLKEYAVQDQAGGHAEPLTVTISTLAGDGGGLLPNINRWRGQLGLASIDVLDKQPLSLLDVPQATAFLINLKANSDNQALSGRRMLVAVVARAGDTWYFKMTGQAEAIGRHQAEFIKAVQSARWSPKAGDSR